MRPGDFLETDDESEGRFRLEESIAVGATHQVVRCSDTARDHRPVVAKAPIVEGDDASLAARNSVLEQEAELLRDAPEGLPGFVDLVEIEASDGTAVPVLLYEFIAGETLFDYVAKRPREVLDNARLLSVVREVGRVLENLHDSGYLFRDVDPRHVIVSEDGEFRRCVGTSNITALAAAPVRPTSDYAEAPYVAPEARHERSGETMRRKADVYGLAALTSYIVTGEEPLTAVESPLNGRAYELLGRAEPVGLAGLVASGLQPVAKHRVELNVFVDHAAPDCLPGAEDPLLAEGEPIKSLPEPWAGAMPPEENRARESRISPGPLISVPRSGDDAEEGGGGEHEGAHSAPVQEFMGETDHVGNDASSESEEVRRTDEGKLAREVSMVDEHLADRENTGGEPQAEPLPDLSELPLRTRVLVGVVLPLGIMLLVILLGLLGVY